MSDRRSIPAVLLAALLALIAPIHQTISAQSKSATLTGVVADSTGRPLEGAQVELIGTTRKTQTGSDGRFQLDDLRPAKYWIFVRRIGYQPFQASLTLEPRELRKLELALTPHPVELPEVKVIAEDKRHQARMREFLWRSRSSFSGRFLTRDDIARSSVSRTGDLVIRYLPFKSLWVMDQPGGWETLGFPSQETFSAARLSSRRLYRPDCPPAVSVNGGSVTPGWAVNDFQPDEIEALEVYREGSSLPYELSWGGRASCGLVVVWLKSYARTGSA
jgi:hypothetical protein